MELPVYLIQRARHRLSLIVVRTGLPRIAPCRPRLAISRSTVQRATVKPSRRNCRQILPHAVDAEVLREDPLNLDLQFGVPLRTGRTLADVDPLGDRRMVGRRGDCNTLQIGSTPYASR